MALRGQGWFNWFLYQPSYEDMTRAASIIKDAGAHGLKAKSIYTVSPGSEQVRATIARDGQLQTFEDFGGVVMANACGPCIGQWDSTREALRRVTRTLLYLLSTEISTSRNDGNPATHAFVASPEITTAFAISGHF